MRAHACMYGKEELVDGDGEGWRMEEGGRREEMSSWRVSLISRHLGASHEIHRVSCVQMLLCADAPAQRIW